MENVNAVRTRSAPADLPRTVMIVGPEPERMTIRGGHIADAQVLLEELATAGIRATVLTDSAGKIEAPLWRRLLRSLGRAVRATREARRLRPDLVIILAGPPASYLEKCVLAGLCRGLGLRSVLCPRSGHMKRALDDGPPILRWALRTVSRLPRAMAVQTESWRRFYAERMHVPAARLEVVENWVVTDSLRATAAEARDHERIGIVYATRLLPAKGIEDVLDMVPIIATKLREHDAIFTIVGDGPAAPRVREVADAYAPHVAWLPSMPRSEFLALLTHQDILVAPSRIEGFPNLLVEAACFGVAIVASPAGGIADVVAHEETGILVPPGEPRRLAAEVVALLEDPARRGRLVRAARAEAMQRFSAGENVRKLVRFGLRGVA